MTIDRTDPGYVEAAPRKDASVNPNVVLTDRVRKVAYIVYTVVAALLGAAGIIAAGNLLPADVQVVVQQVVDTGSKVVLYLAVTFGLVAANNVRNDGTNF